MSKTIKDAYQEFNIPPNLQKHQLRVAYICHKITSTWRDQPDIDHHEVTQAGLFHDMGNLIKFNFAIPGMLEGEDINYWQQAQKRFIAAYGTNVHQATLAICQQIGLKPSIIDTISLAEWDDTPKLLQLKQYSTCILIYADMRVGPHGIIPYPERITNLNQRSPSPNYRNRLEYAQLIETALQPHTKTSLSHINDTGFEAFSRNIVLDQIKTA